MRACVSVRVCASAYACVFTHAFIFWWQNRTFLSPELGFYEMRCTHTLYVITYMLN